jgi:deoxyribonuclease-4
MVHRVRSLIPHLQYGELRKQNIIPKKPFFTGIKRGGKFPSQAKKIGYTTFGLFIDHLIEKIIALIHSIDYPHRDKSVYQIYSFCVDDKNQVLPKEQFLRDKDYYMYIAQFTEYHFQEHKYFELEPEWVVGDIAGHPDIVADDTIFDVKTTGQFSSMRSETILQLLSYYCLAQQLGKKINHIGLVLPAQNLVLKTCLTGWDWRRFWEKLNLCIRVKVSLRPTDEILDTYRSYIEPFVGSHISRDGTIYKTLQNYGNFRPCQIFLAGRCSANFKITQKDIEETVKLNSKFYIHSPYIINLSKRYDDNWSVDSVVRAIQSGEKMGCHGVVVHCGVKAKGVEYDTAYNNMLWSVEYIASKINGSCPLLIETSAGETGELLPECKELINFYQNLSIKARHKIKICVDTCHVFASGQEPYNFLTELESKNIPVGLIHFNDSKGEKGCKKDLHETIGRGYIGLEKLIVIARYAIRKNIDLVNE